jgi:predicted phosphate transport protein (TIGR00153 family)
VVRLLPRDQRFFDLFTQVATLNVEAARALRDLLAAPLDRRSYLVETIKRLEHDADGITHELVTRLDKSFITPLDREDIHMLASRLDDVLDRIDGTARRVTIFRAEAAPAGTVLLADVIFRATEQLLKAVKVLENGKAGVVIAACIEVKRLEEEGDSAYADWLGRLFDEASDPIALIKWKEIYDTLEKTLDQAEDVANVLESIAIKHS